jgi:hypothetical protein
MVALPKLSAYFSQFLFHLLVKGKSKLIKYLTIVAEWARSRVTLYVSALETQSGTKNFFRKKMDTYLSGIDCFDKHAFGRAFSEV